MSRPTVTGNRFVVLATGDIDAEMDPVDSGNPLAVTIVGGGGGGGGGDASAANQSTIIGHVDGIETALTTIAGHVDGLEGFVDGLEGQLGIVTETAPASDTASSGLNGRLQRLAQHLTTIAGHVDGVETLLGSTNTLLTTQNTYLDGLEGFVDGLEGQLGSLTETAPASDTASSGLNGRMQRVAQRITSLIALLPTALGAGGGLKVDGSGTALPVSGPQTNAEFIAALKSTATHSSVASGTSSVTILASNSSRKGARIFNTDANNLFLDLSGGTAAAATRAQVVLAQNAGYDVPFGCTGTITGIWSADGSGVASVVEFA